MQDGEKGSRGQLLAAASVTGVSEERFVDRQRIRDSVRTCLPFHCELLAGSHREADMFKVPPHMCLAKHDTSDSSGQSWGRDRYFQIKQTSVKRDI